MNAHDIAVTRRLLAYAKEQGWVRRLPGRLPWGRWECEGFRVDLIQREALAIATDNRPRLSLHYLVVQDGKVYWPTFGSVLVTSAQQAADILAAVGLVPVEMTSGWRAARRAYGRDMYEAVTS